MRSMMLKLKRTKKNFPTDLLCISVLRQLLLNVFLADVESSCALTDESWIHPSTMEMLVVMLRFNRDIWDEFIVDAAIKVAEPVRAQTLSNLTTPISASSSAQVHADTDSD
jgi:hypothetical protein